MYSTCDAVQCGLNVGGAVPADGVVTRDSHFYVVLPFSCLAVYIRSLLSLQWLCMSCSLQPLSDAAVQVGSTHHSCVFSVYTLHIVILFPPCKCTVF